MSNESRAAFEAWVKSVHLDGVTRVKDEWGDDCYLPHINSMWFGWQASRKVALEEARVAIHCIALVRVGTALECGEAIKELMK